MAVCLDTGFLVDLLAGEEEALRFVAQMDEPAIISAISIYELMYGVRTEDGAREVYALVRDYAIVPADTEVCEVAAAIQSRLRDRGQVIPVLDAFIAATSVLANAPLVTSDGHLQRVPASFGLVLRAY